MDKSRADVEPMALDEDPAPFQAFAEIDFIAHLAENEFARALPDDLTPAQFGVLNRLVRLGRAETISALAAAFQVAQPTMSSTVKRLAEKRFVDLVPDTEDARIKRVAVTVKGRAVRRRAVRALDPFWETLAREAPAIDWAGLLDALTPLRDYLDKRRA